MKMDSEESRADNKLIPFGFQQNVIIRILFIVHTVGIAVHTQKTITAARGR